jgi:hypothetical protein
MGVSVCVESRAQPKTLLLTSKLVAAHHAIPNNTAILHVKRRKRASERERESRERERERKRERWKEIGGPGPLLRRRTALVGLLPKGIFASASPPSLAKPTRAFG